MRNGKSSFYEELGQSVHNAESMCRYPRYQFQFQSSEARSVKNCTTTWSLHYRVHSLWFSLPFMLSCRYWVLCMKLSQQSSLWLNHCTNRINLKLIFTFWLSRVEQRHIHSGSKSNTDQNPKHWIKRRVVLVLQQATKKRNEFSLWIHEINTFCKTTYLSPIRHTLVQILYSSERWRNGMCWVQ